MLCLAVAALSLISSTASAARVRLQARSELTLHVDEVGGELLVRGRLRERGGGAIAGATVALRWQVAAGAADADDVLAALRAAVVRSGERGHFEHRFSRLALPSGEVRAELEAHFAGDPSHAATTTVEHVALGLPTPRLVLRASPEVVDSDADELRVEVALAVGAVPIGGRVVALRVAADGEHGAGGGSDAREIARVVTDDQGAATLSLALAKLGRLGLVEIEGEALGDDEVGPARGHVLVEVSAAVRVHFEALAADADAGCDDDTVCIRGAVDVRGLDGVVRAPAAAAVTLHASRIRLGTVPVGPDGRFAARLRHDVLRRLVAPGVLGVVAEAVVAAPYHPTGWSDVVAIDVPPPRSILEWIYAALLAAVIVGLALRRWRDRRRAREVQSDLAAVAAGLSPVQVRSLGPGGDGAMLRGVVLHGEHGRATAATLRLRGPEGLERELADGRFVVGPLAPGSWQLRVEVAEHVPLELEISLPHDGTFDGCALLPRSCRAVVRGALSERVEAASGRPVDWRRETPRAAEPRWLAARRRGHARIRAAVSAVEALLYGRRVDLDAVAAVEAELADAEREAP